MTGLKAAKQAMTQYAEKAAQDAARKQALAEEFGNDAKEIVRQAFVHNAEALAKASYPVITYADLTRAVVQLNPYNRVEVRSDRVTTIFSLEPNVTEDTEFRFDDAGWPDKFARKLQANLLRTPAPKISRL